MQRGPVVPRGVPAGGLCVLILHWDKRAQLQDVGRPWRGGVMLDGQPCLPRAVPEEGLSCEPSRRQHLRQLGRWRNECPQVGLVCTTQHLLQGSGPRISTSWELGTR